MRTRDGTAHQETSVGSSVGKMRGHYRRYRQSVCQVGPCLLR